MLWNMARSLIIMVLCVQVLVPQVEKMCIDKGVTDETEILRFLQHGTLVGLLPVPHPILIRRYQANTGTDLWIRWGPLDLEAVFEGVLTLQNHTEKLLLRPLYLSKCVLKDIFCNLGFWMCIWKLRPCQTLLTSLDQIKYSISVNILLSPGPTCGVWCTWGAGSPPSGLTPQSRCLVCRGSSV